MPSITIQPTQNPSTGVPDFSQGITISGTPLRLEREQLDTGKVRVSLKVTTDGLERTLALIEY